MKTKVEIEQVSNTHLCKFISSPVIWRYSANARRSYARASSMRLANSITIVLHHVFRMWFLQCPKKWINLSLSVIPFTLEIQMICTDVLDWHTCAVGQFSSDRDAPRVLYTHKSYFTGIAVIKSSRSGSLAYIYSVCLRQPFRSHPHLVNWSTMVALWHSEVPSSGMMSPARHMVLNFVLVVRTPKIIFIISVPFWYVALECNCLTWIKFPMNLSTKHLVIR